MSLHINEWYGPRVARVLAIGVFCSACAQPPGPMAAAADPGDSGLASIEQLIGDAPCHSDAECRVIGVGAKACGGPQAYRAWSTSATDAQALQERVDRDAATRRAELQRRGMRSNCSITPAPDVVCKPAASPGGPGRCTLVSTSAGRR